MLRRRLELTGKQQNFGEEAREGRATFLLQEGNEMEKKRLNGWGPRVSERDYKRDK